MKNRLSVTLSREEDIRLANDPEISYVIISLSDIDPSVEEVIGVPAFLKYSEDAQTIFI